MASIISMKEAPHFYKVKVELAPPSITLRPLMLTLPAIKPKTEPTVLLQPIKTL